MIGRSTCTHLPVALGAGATIIGRTLPPRDPDMPDELFNRAADNWRPLLAIADAAGGDWPERARAAAVRSVASEKDEGLRIMLLADIQSIFRTRKVDPISSDQIVADLCQLEGRPVAGLPTRPANK